MIIRSSGDILAGLFGAVCNPIRSSHSNRTTDPIAIGTSSNQIFIHTQLVITLGE